MRLNLPCNLLVPVTVVSREPEEGGATVWQECPLFLLTEGMLKMLEI